MFDSDDELYELLEQMNEVARKGWQKWRESFDDSPQPPVAYMLRPGDDAPYSAEFNVLEKMPDTLDERISVLADMGYKVGQSIPDVRVFFLMQEAWSAEVDGVDEVPDGPVRNMDDSIEVLVATGMTQDGTVLHAEQPIEGDGLAEHTRMTVNHDTEAPLINAFWEGYSQAQN